MMTTATTTDNSGHIQHGSLNDVLRGVVGFSFLAAMLAGVAASYFGFESGFQSSVTIIGAALGGFFGYRQQ
ncbi:MAG: hypothetical protein WCJ64_00790 [Rhodospirillaceae bacterium]